MEELNTPIFAQAKVEYTKQLIEILYSHMFDGIKSIYDESKIIYSSKTGIPILLLFRELLEKVPIWNGEIINSECSRIINNSKCDWIDDLITAVFISHTKILTSIGPNQSFQKINVTIPKTSTFIHKAYINTAREIWKNPYLFNENVPGYEYQKNNKEIENIIKNCIETTIRNLLPIKEILKEHLEGETDNNLLNQKEEIKKLLREELNELKSNIKISEKEESQNKDETEGTELDEENKDETEGTEGTELDEENKNEFFEDSIIEPTIIKEENIIESEIEDIIEPKIIKEKEKEKEIEEQQFPISDDPTDEQIENQCNNIIVNDITIPVDIPKDIQEEKYDNIEITENKSNESDIDANRLKRLMTNMEVKEEINVVKSEEINNSLIPTQSEIKSEFVHESDKLTSEPKPINESDKLTSEPKPINESDKLTSEPISNPSFSFNSLYPNMNKSNSVDVEKLSNEQSSEIKPLEIIKETEPIIIEEYKSPRKEVVKIENNNEIDETSSLANFFNDVKQIAVDKGIKIETNKDNNYSLFEDASEVEK